MRIANMYENCEYENICIITYFTMALFDFFSLFTGIIAVLLSTSSMGENDPILKSKNNTIPRNNLAFVWGKIAPYKGAKIWLHSQGPK